MWAYVSTLMEGTSLFDLLNPKGNFLNSLIQTIILWVIRGNLWIIWGKPFPIGMSIGRY